MYSVYIEYISIGKHPVELDGLNHIQLLHIGIIESLGVFRCWADFVSLKIMVARKKAAELVAPDETVPWYVGKHGWWGTKS